MRTRLPFFGRGASVLFLGSLLGCTSNPSPTGSTVPPTVLATGLANAFCAACCGSSATTTSDGGTNACAGDTGADASAGCVERATLSADQQLSLISTAFSEGLLTIDPMTSTACAMAYQQNATCTGDGPDVQAAVNDPACATLFVGYIPVGERCDMTAECQSGNYCLSQGTGQPVTSIFGSGSLGTCFPYQTVGMPCNTTADCKPPSTCSPTSFLCES